MRKILDHYWLLMIRRKSSLIIRSVVFFLLSYFVVEKAFFTLEPYATGDGFEYVMMTEAFFNHATPEIRPADLRNFKKDHMKVSPWETNMKHEYFDLCAAQMSDSLSHAFMHEVSGCFVDRNNKVYSYHFFFYSMLNVPARWAMNIFHQVPLKCFQVTNAILILFTSFILLFYKPFETGKACLLAISFVYCATFWYIGWTHAEVYTICLVALSLWMSFRNHYYWAIFLAALASLQNQPLVVLVVLLDARAFFEQKKSSSTLIKIALASILVLWPSAFYYYHYHIANLVQHQGFLSNEYITFTRFIGFYIDLNQGAILAIPVALFLFIGLWIRVVYLDISGKKKIDWLDFLPLVLIVITISVCTMGNWNHGQAVINRYASWISVMIVLITFIWLSKSGFSDIVQYSAMTLIAVSQYWSVNYFERDNKFDWMAGSIKPPAKWVIEHCPQFYNPDPVIFMARQTGGYELFENKEPILYYSSNGRLCKMMVYRDRLDSLERIGFSATDIEQYKKSMNFVNGWGYINDPESHITSFRIKQLSQERRQRNIHNMIKQIKGNKSLYESVVVKSTEYGISVDSMLQLNAVYLLDRGQEEN